MLGVVKKYILLRWGLIYLLLLIRLMFSGFRAIASCSVSSLVYLNGPMSCTLDICCETCLCVIELFVFCFTLVNVLMLVYGSFMCI